MNRLSVVIATYRRPEGLRRAIESLRRQVRPPDEVIAVAWEEDAPTRAVLEGLAKGAREGGAPEINAVLTPARGVTAQENAGIQAARGDIVCFMDDDAVARPDWMRRLEGHYANPTVGAVGGRDVIWLDGRVLQREVRTVGRVHWYGRLVANHHQWTSGIRDVDFLKGCNMSFRREALLPIDRRLVGTIPYGFEIDLGLLARDRGWRVVYDPELRVDHYPTTHYGTDALELSWVVNHNQTYVLLKHLTWPRKLVFLTYTFSIGDKNTIGAARVPFLALLRRWPAAAFRAQFAGKMAGIRTYVRSGPRGRSHEPA